MPLLTLQPPSAPMMSSAFQFTSYAIFRCPALALTAVPRPLPPPPPPQPRGPAAATPTTLCMTWAQPAAAPTRPTTRPWHRHRPTPRAPTWPLHLRTHTTAGPLPRDLCTMTLLNTPPGRPQSTPPRQPQGTLLHQLPRIARAPATGPGATRMRQRPRLTLRMSLLPRLLGQPQVTGAAKRPQNPFWRLQGAPCTYGSD